MPDLAPRFAIAVLALCLCLFGAARSDAQNDDGTLTPVVAIHDESYGAARAHFRTNLLVRGASPQHLEMPSAPAGVRALDFPSGDLRLRAWLSPAPHRGRMPVVVFLHGGFAFGEEDWDMTAPFREAGFLVVAPILRGENGQPGTYSLFYDETDDVVALIDFLRRRQDVDAHRIFLAGHSSGATLALLAAMRSRRVRAVASFSGSPDQALFTRYGMNPRQIPFDANDARELEMRSPLSFATSLRRPTRLYFGTEEPHFRLSTQRLAAVAKAAGRDVEAIEVEGDHFSALPAEMAASIAFFRAQR